MCFLKSKHSWLAAPLLWLGGILVLILTWSLATPAWITAHFDNKGSSPVESTTVGLFFVQIAFLWLLPPMRQCKQRLFWLADFSLITLFAICRELDWHKLLITASHLPGTTHGTPFKMKLLTNPGNPLSDRLIVAACFVAVIVICGGTLLYFLRRLISGLFKLHPVCWSIGFFGGTCILIQIVDRLPAVLRHDFKIVISEHLHALTLALEEGQELLLPLMIILAIIQAHFIYNDDADSHEPFIKFKEL